MPLIRRLATQVLYRLGKEFSTANLNDVIHINAYILEASPHDFVQFLSTNLANLPRLDYDTLQNITNMCKKHQASLLLDAEIAQKILFSLLYRLHCVWHSPRNNLLKTPFYIAFTLLSKCGVTYDQVRF